MSWWNEKFVRMRTDAVAVSAIVSSTPTHSITFALPSVGSLIGIAPSNLVSGRSFPPHAVFRKHWRATAGDVRRAVKPPSHP
jgi:hypothetical protein